MAQGAVAAYKAAGKPFNIVLTLRTDDVGMGCTFKQIKNPNFKMSTTPRGTRRSASRSRPR